MMGWAAQSLWLSYHEPDETSGDMRYTDSKYTLSNFYWTYWDNIGKYNYMAFRDTNL